VNETHERPDLSDHDLLVRIDGRTENMCDTIGHHDTDLNGNGKLGLKRDMVVAQAEIRLILWIGGAVTLAVIGLIVTSIWKAVSVPVG
jgi:hypothetical protein